MKNNNFIPGLVSIIVPVYKAKEYIEKSIQSIINQSYKNIEIILVDDFGNDGSVDLAKSILQSSESNWKILRHDINKGVSAARNYGVEEAKGEYLYFVDADDYIPTYCIEKHVEAAALNHSDMVFANHIDVYPSGEKPSIRVSGQSVVSDNSLKMLCEGKIGTMVCNILLRRDFYRNSRVSFKVGMRGEDSPWVFSLIARARKISLLAECTYFYCRWTGSYTMSLRKNLSFIEDWYYFIYNCTVESKQIPFFENYYFRRWYARSILTFCEELYISELSHKDKHQWINKLFLQVRLPIKELNIASLGLFSVLNCLLPKTYAMYVLVKVRKLLRSFRNLLRLSFRKS